MKRLIIAGGRDFNDFDRLCSEMELLFLVADELYFEDMVILSGKAKGADALGEEWAFRYQVPVEEYPADWDKYGKSAGYKRNEQMAQNADVLMAFWDGESKGTKHMIDLAIKYKLETHVYIYEKAN